MTEAVTHYQSSKGPKEIATMHAAHLSAALNKLEDTGYAPERQPEVDAMTARLAQLNEEFAQSQVTS